MATRFVRLEEIPGQARARVRLTGPDTRRFMQGTVSADVPSVKPGHAVAAGLLTVKGKLVSELVMLPHGEEGLDLLVPKDQAANVAELLDKHIIMDEVEVQGPSPVSVALLFTDDGTLPALHRDNVHTFETRHPAPGLLAIAEARDLEAALAGFDRADEDGYHRHRVVTASPAWGRELDLDRFPPEVGFVYAVSYDKGCYLGQEPLARIHARGQVNRVLVRVEGEPNIATPVELVHPERKNAGTLSTYVPDGDKGIGLAIVRRSLAQPGTSLELEGSAGRTVSVVSDPLGDDPGVGGRNRATTVKLGGR